jgi:hypothetical protein
MLNHLNELRYMMANLETLDITVPELMRHLNPTLDPDGLQFGAIFSLTGLDPDEIRLNDSVVELTLSFQVGMNQLQGYLLVINGNYNDILSVIANSESTAEGVVQLQVEGALPETAGDWSIICKHTRVDYTQEKSEKLIKRAVREMKSFIRPDYMDMMTQINGQMLWSPDQMNVESLVIQLPFYKASNVRVWKGVIYDYKYRLDEAVELTINTDFTVTHDDEEKISRVTLSETPADDTRLAIDYSHTLDPVPETLKEFAMDMAKIIVLHDTPNIRSNVTYEQIQLMRNDLNERMKQGVYEFDSLFLYRETKRRRLPIHTDIKINRS